MNMAPTGQNGDNETYIGSSKSLGYSLYDENKNEIPIKDQKKPIEYWIPKDASVPIEPFKFVDAKNATVVNETTKFVYMNGFFLNGSNNSVHIQIKPINKIMIGYLLLLKFGDNPTLEQEYYDEWVIFCPTGISF